MRLKVISATRVAMHSSKDVNQRIHREMEASIDGLANGDPAALHTRLQELQREWDVDRAVTFFSGILATAGVALAATVSKRFLLVPALGGLFVLQHAATGWSPATSILRRMGFRTGAEINHERYALKVLRGDFHALPDHREALKHSAAAQLLHMVRC